MARPELVNGEIYHIYNRGTDGRKIFLDECDYFRFVHDLFEFNDKEAVNNLKYRFLEKHKPKRRKRQLLIGLLAFSLMPNHFHLMVMQRVENGISKFMQKLGTGYTNYFNTKFERKGVLFQGKYKVKLIAEETHFTYLPHYIHLNPLDLIGMKWRVGKIGDLQKAFNFLQSYRWTSCLDYIDKKNFPSVTQRDFLLKVFNEEGGYKRSLLKWMRLLKPDQLKGIAID